MCKENYKLTFEKYFSKENECDIDVHDYQKVTEKGEKFNGPSFVDETRKDLSSNDTVCYKKSNVNLSENGLSLKAVNENGIYCGAHVTLKDKSFGNGYLEVKAKLPPIMPAIAPKISLRGEQQNCFFSIDFVQVLGLKGKNECALKAAFLTEGVYKPINFLYSHNNSWPTLYPPFESEELLSEGWHTFGFEKDDEFATFYVDGNEYCKVDLDTPIFKVFTNETILDFSLNIGLRETEEINEDTVLPCEMLIEYVKFYERG